MSAKQKQKGKSPYKKYGKSPYQYSPALVGWHQAIIRGDQRAIEQFDRQWRVQFAMQKPARVPNLHLTFVEAAA